MSDQKPLVNYTGVPQPIQTGDTLGIPIGGTGSTTLYQEAEFPGLDWPRGYSLTKQGVLIAPGASGWNQSMVMSPDVFFDPILGLYRMVFVGYTQVAGNPSVASLGYATASSPAGPWTLFGSNPFFSASGAGLETVGITGPRVWFENGTYYLFYIGLTATGFEQGTKTILMATSTDFVTWTRRGIMIATAPAVDWRSQAVWRTNIVKRGSLYYLFFNATNSAGQENIGYATSSVLTGPWTVDDVNSPILSVGAGAAWDNNHVADPYVYRIGSTWFMGYMGYNGTTGNLQSGFATTSDANFPLGWTKFASNPILVNGGAGSIDFKSAGQSSLWPTPRCLYNYYTTDNGSGLIEIAVATDNTLTGQATVGVTIAQLQSTESKNSGVFAHESWASGAIIRDDFGAWSSGAATRFTTPNGIGRVRITGHSSWAANATGGRWINLYKNNSFFNGIQQPADAVDVCRYTFVSNWMQVTPGDYFEIEFGQTSGGALNLTGSTTNGADAASIQLEWGQ